MAIYSDEMASFIGAQVAYTAMTGSPYSPLASGRLIQLKLLVYGSAATALIEGLVVKVESPSFSGVPVHVMAAGAGIRTAPAFPIPAGITNCDVSVQTGVPLTITIKNVTADTPVTVEATLIGVFEG